MATELLLAVLAAVLLVFVLLCYGLRVVRWCSFWGLTLSISLSSFTYGGMNSFWRPERASSADGTLARLAMRGGTAGPSPLTLSPLPLDGHKMALPRAIFCPVEQSSNAQQCSAAGYTHRICPTTSTARAPACSKAAMITGSFPAVCSP